MRHFFLFLLLCFGNYLVAQSDDYRFRLTDPFDAVAYPLRTLRTSIDLRGGLAYVEHEQVFVNDQSTPLTASLLFPLSPDVHPNFLHLRTAAQTLNGWTVADSLGAHRGQNNGTQSGRATALIECVAPNLYRTRVTNLPPGDTVYVSFGYRQAATTYGNGIFSLAHPLVVAPEQLDPCADWGGQTYTQELPDYGWELTVRLLGDVLDFGSSSHRLEVAATDSLQTILTLHPAETGNTHRDFALDVQFAEAYEPWRPEVYRSLPSWFAVGDYPVVEPDAPNGELTQPLPLPETVVGEVYTLGLLGTGGLPTQSAQDTIPLWLRLLLALSFGGGFLYFAHDTVRMGRSRRQPLP